MHQILINGEPARTANEVASAIQTSPATVTIRGNSTVGHFTYSGTLAGLHPKSAIAFKTEDGGFGLIEMNAAGELAVT